MNCTKLKHLFKTQDGKEVGLLMVDPERWDDEFLGTLDFASGLCAKLAEAEKERDLWFHRSQEHADEKEKNKRDLKKALAEIDKLKAESAERYEVIQVLNAHAEERASVNDALRVNLHNVELRLKTAKDISDEAAVNYSNLLTRIANIVGGMPGVDSVLERTRQLSDRACNLRRDLETAIVANDSMVQGLKESDDKLAKSENLADLLSRLLANTQAERSNWSARALKAEEELKGLQREMGKLKVAVHDSEERGSFSLATTARFKAIVKDARAVLGLDETQFLVPELKQVVAEREQSLAKLNDMTALRAEAVRLKDKAEADLVQVQAALMQVQAMLRKLEQETDFTTNCSYCKLGMTANSYEEHEANIQKMIQHVEACDKNPVTKELTELREFKERIERGAKHDGQPDMPRIYGATTLRPDGAVVSFVQGLEDLQRFALDGWNLASYRKGLIENLEGALFEKGREILSWAEHDSKMRKYRSQLEDNVDELRDKLAGSESTRQTWEAACTMRDREIDSLRMKLKKTRASRDMIDQYLTEACKAAGDVDADLLAETIHELMLPVRVGDEVVWNKTNINVEGVIWPASFVVKGKVMFYDNCTKEAIVACGLEPEEKLPVDKLYVKIRNNEAPIKKENA